MPYQYNENEYDVVKKSGPSGSGQNASGTSSDDMILMDAFGGTQLSQIHGYAGDGDDYLELSFSPISSFSEGHHVRGDIPSANDYGTWGGSLFSDTFNFTNTQNVGSDIVVGRIEDFDFSRDTIELNGAELDWSNLPSNVRLIRFNGEYNDHADDPQLWLHIENASGGHILYALEGARVDMTGNGGSKDTSDEDSPGYWEQERHFVHKREALETDTGGANTGAVRDWDAILSGIADAQFVDPVNFVPLWYQTQFSANTAYNDLDAVQSDVWTDSKILMTNSDEGIAGGLNDDWIEANGGNDHVWGGSGHDRVYGGGGSDYVEGNSGNDELYGDNGADTIKGGLGDDYAFGGDGNDTISGGDGNDELIGGTGSDTINGDDGNDVIKGWAGNDTLWGSAGNDTLRGNAGDDTLGGGQDNDWLSGGGGADTLRGGGGKDFIWGGEDRDDMWGDYTGGGGTAVDTFHFRAGDMIDLAASGWNSAVLDVIHDFNIGQDKIEFHSDLGLSDLSDLQAWKETINGDVHFVVMVQATKEAILLNVDDSLGWSDVMDADNFTFG